MPTTTNYGWTTPADTDLVKDGASAIRTLGTAIDTTVFNNASAAIAKSIVDAKGDIIAATAADTVTRLAVGSNDQVLIADSSTATGLKWGTPSGGGLTLISEQVANANTAIDFNSISGNYKQLLLVWSGIKHSGTGGGFGIRLNSSSSNIYYFQSLYVDGSSAGNAFGVTTSIPDDPFGHRANGTNFSSQANGWLYIDNYASTTKVKTWLLRFSYRDNGAATNRSYSDVGVFDSTTAVTSVNIFRRSGTDTISNDGNTSIRLYGLS